ncbi:MICAL-like protein 1 isoform X2 [Cynoglossus semilaevis]|uniref:MICAL-like protein 1 isoform X2 n=1 Tax=Cynoglossus semilaevis TaxID=244447 RepID=UPI000D62DB10|nr:MICAL-like protein 1 isoform X2 [Cynoglossus semilaevis]
MKYHVKAINVSGHGLRMTSVRDLRDWSRGVCATYPNVDIKDMSTSFRNGLAFCAIIHKHRPDLIDFSSLSKKNIYQNNKLAFTVAETRLGVSALLDPKELVSNKVPDGLSIVTYLSQLYFYFNRKSLAGPAGLSSSHGAVLNKTGDSSKPLKSVTHLETDHFSNTRTRMVCHLCLKPVHLIQRHLIDGKFYHLSCFRCKLCHSTLLPESYKQGGDAQSLICTYHITIESPRSDSNQFIGSVENHPECNIHAGFSSYSGLCISSVPHYTNKTMAQDEPVFKTSEMEATEEQQRNSKDMERENLDSTEEFSGVSTNPPPPDSPAPRDEQTDTEAAPIQTNSDIQEEVVVNQQPSADLSACGEVTQRDDGVDPGPTVISAPVLQKNDTSAAAGINPAGVSSNQHRPSLTPAQSSGQTAGRSKVKLKHPWMTIIHPGPWTQLPPAAPPVAPSHLKSLYRPCGPWYRTRAVPSNPFVEKVPMKARSEHQRKSRVTAVGSEINGTESAAQGGAGVAGTQCLTPNVSPSQRKSMTKSQSLQSLSSKRVPAPGHGFPLVKRKVQTDECGSTQNLETQMREVGERLEEVQQRGVQLEKKLRECQDAEEEEQMLMDWFSLLCERQVLVRRDTELVYLTKQQHLEERQADVEYEIRCILNKPEKDKSPEDQGREQQLMDELVSIIEERDHIIGSLDLDRQREQEEEGVSKAFLKNKEIQKEGLKEMKKSKGKMNPTNIFKILNHKVENTEDHRENNS